MGIEMEEGGDASTRVEAVVGKLRSIRYQPSTGSDDSDKYQKYDAWSVRLFQNDFVSVEIREFKSYETTEASIEEIINVRNPGERTVQLTHFTSIGDTFDPNMSQPGIIKRFEKGSASGVADALKESTLRMNFDELLQQFIKFKIKIEDPWSFVWWVHRVQRLYDVIDTEDGRFSTMETTSDELGTGIKLKNKVSLAVVHLVAAAVNVATPVLFCGPTRDGATWVSARLRGDVFVGKDNISDKMASDVVRLVSTLSLLEVTHMGLGKENTMYWCNPYLLVDRFETEDIFTSALDYHASKLVMLHMFAVEMVRRGVNKNSAFIRNLLQEAFRESAAFLMPEQWGSQGNNCEDLNRQLEEAKQSRHLNSSSEGEYKTDDEIEKEETHKMRRQCFSNFRRFIYTVNYEDKTAENYNELILRRIDSFLYSVADLITTKDLEDVSFLLSINSQFPKEANVTSIPPEKQALIEDFQPYKEEWLKDATPITDAQGNVEKAFKWPVSRPAIEDKTIDSIQIGFKQFIKDNMITDSIQIGFEQFITDNMIAFGKDGARVISFFDVLSRWISQKAPVSARQRHFQQEKDEKEQQKLNAIQEKQNKEEAKKRQEQFKKLYEYVVILHTPLWELAMTDTLADAVLAAKSQDPKKDVFYNKAKEYTRMFWNTREGRYTLSTGVSDVNLGAMNTQTFQNLQVGKLPLSILIGLYNRINNLIETNRNKTGDDKIAITSSLNHFKDDVSKFLDTKQQQQITKDAYLDVDLPYWTWGLDGIDNADFSEFMNISLFSTIEWPRIPRHADGLRIIKPPASRGNAPPPPPPPPPPPRPRAMKATRPAATGQQNKHAFEFTQEEEHLGLSELEAKIARRKAVDTTYTFIDTDISIFDCLKLANNTSDTTGAPPTEGNIGERAVVANDSITRFIWELPLTMDASTDVQPTRLAEAIRQHLLTNYNKLLNDHSNVFEQLIKTEGGLTSLMSVIAWLSSRFALY